MGPNHRVGRSQDGAKSQGRDGRRGGPEKRKGRSKEGGIYQGGQITRWGHSHGTMNVRDGDTNRGGNKQPGRYQLGIVVHRVTTH